MTETPAPLPVPLVPALTTVPPAPSHLGRWIAVGSALLAALAAAALVLAWNTQARVKTLEAELEANLLVQKARDHQGHYLLLATAQ